MNQRTSVPDVDIDHLPHAAEHDRISVRKNGDGSWWFSRVPDDGKPLDYVDPWLGYVLAWRVMVLPGTQFVVSGYTNRQRRSWCLHSSSAYATFERRQSGWVLIFNEVPHLAHSLDSFGPSIELHVARLAPQMKLELEKTHA